MLIRVRGPTGMERVEVSESDTVETLFLKVQDAVQIEKAFRLARSPNGMDEIDASRTSDPIASLGLKHGAMLYLIVQRDDSDEARSSEPVLEVDKVDRELIAKDGRVSRERDPMLCRHGAHQKCINCTDLDPFDPRVQMRDGVPIKYMSFHTYLKQLNSGADRGKFTQLEDLRCTVLPGCLTHKPWPAGRCSKCQPGTVHLQDQKFRHVDYIQFERPDIIDRFIDFWRRSGQQRVGFLYGRYEPMEEWIPLGIKAVVSAIYEPPQMNSADGFEFLDDPHQQDVDEMAKRLGLQKVGWIYTDLVQEGNGVAQTRFVSEDNALFSAPEIMQAAMFQNQNPNVVDPKYIRSQKFGSKFVTVVITGDEHNQVTTMGFQVSNQAMALVRDDVILPSPDNCAKMLVKPSTDEQFVPDIYYRGKDEYGNEVQKDTKDHFPVEYLTIVCECGSSGDQGRALFAEAAQPFVIENRAALGDMQDITSLARHFRQPGSFYNKVSDFHLLVYMDTADLFSSLKPMLPTLLDAVREKQQHECDTWQENHHWQTIRLIMQDDHAAGGGGGSSGGGRAATGSDSAMWSCSKCTFLNPPGRTSCDVCASAR